MTTLSRQQVLDIWSMAPKGTDKTSFINDLIAEGYQLEGINAQPKEPTFAQNAGQFAMGAIKGIGQEIKNTAESLPGAMEMITNPIGYAANKITGGETLQERALNAVKNTNSYQELNKALEPSNDMQKYGSYAGKAVALLTPAGLEGKAIRAEGAATRALELSNKELSKVNTKALQYLSKKAIGKSDTTGGILKEKTPVMAKEVKSLANDFKELLKSSDPVKNIKAVEKAGLDLKKKTLSLFDGNERAINYDTIKKMFYEAVKNDTKNIYGVDKKEITEKALNGFLSKVAKGTNKGLEEARIAWRAEKSNIDGKLSKANDVLHGVVKKVIKETLPETEKKLYDKYKTEMAKGFDVIEILSAKNRASMGDSLLKKATSIIPFRRR